MADLDLKDALTMFTQGTKDLAFSRAVNGANDQIQQIKASEMNEQEQRAAHQDIANQLVSKLAMTGAPADRIKETVGAVGPKQFANPAAMIDEAALTGSPYLRKAGLQAQGDIFNLEAKKELLKSKGLIAAFGAQAKQDQHKLEFETNKQKDFDTSIDASAATSRSGFGQWAATDNRGARLDAIAGDPSTWTTANPELLELLKEGTVQMSKGGVMTSEEHKAMSPFMIKLAEAQAKTALTGEPQTLDLSGFFKLYTGVSKREGDVSKKRITDIILSKATGNKNIHDLSDRAAANFKASVASKLNTYGGYSGLTPDDIVHDKKTGFTIRPGAGTSTTPKRTLSSQDIKAYAAREGKSEAEAKSFLKGHGYAVD